MKILAILLNIAVPGLGHILIDRHLAGFLHFLGFAIFADGIWVGLGIWIGEGGSIIFWFAVLGAAVMWTYSLGELLRHVWFLDHGKLRAEMEEHFFAGLEYYFQGALPDARDEFREVLTLDETNISARLMIAFAQGREKQAARARKIIKECQNLDRKGRWHSEIEEALRALERMEQENKTA